MRVNLSGTDVIRIGEIAEFEGKDPKKLTMAEIESIITYALIRYKVDLQREKK